MLTKIFSFARKLHLNLRSYYSKLLCEYGMQGVKLGTKVFFYQHTYISCTDGGQIVIGDNVAICQNVKLIANGGNITIGDNVHIGDGSIIVARENINISNDVLIGEYVVIRDQNHSLQSRPIRSAGFDMSAIDIGSDVWIGAKATVLRGVSIGSEAVIGAHALVNTAIAEKSLAVGCPATIIKQL